ncbi:ABC transporter substrate-binding protein, partial [Methylobacterium sp. E-066]|uniref:ABC transporter substrate-binding protein n=1 Tax=Methylobacterium sp. E-066 TaxID=2836584 RepID=UPI001FBB7896
VEKIDDLSIRILFDKPTPYWSDAFVGTVGMVIPKHLFAAYTGAKSREAPQNLAPVGTGPYRFLEFRPGDIVRGERNPNYHLPNRPYFDSVEMKGGGDAVSAARAVLQTGEYDYAWNLLVEDEVLKRLETGGKGRIEREACVLRDEALRAVHRIGRGPAGAAVDVVLDRLAIDQQAHRVA